MTIFYIGAVSIYRLNNYFFYFKKVIELDKYDFESYEWIGRALFDQENYAGTVAMLDKVIELNPSYVNSYFIRGRALFEQDLYEQAVEAFTKVTQLDEFDFESHDWKGRCEIGYIYYINLYIRTNLFRFYSSSNGTV